MHRAQLGISGQTINPDMAEGLSLEIDHGVIVSDVEPEGAAAHAGVEADDIITGIDGRNVTSLAQLEARVFRLTPGTKISLRIQRGREFDGTAGHHRRAVWRGIGRAGRSGGSDTECNRCAGHCRARPINAQVVKLMPDLRRPAGVVVAARKANAPFSGPPLEVGDVIYSVNRQTVSGVAQLRSVVEQYKSGRCRRAAGRAQRPSALHSITA